MLAVLYCFAISTLYVASLYIWRVPASRQHPATVRARMLSVLMTCSVAWLPAWHMHRKMLQELNCSSTPSRQHMDTLAAANSTPSSPAAANLAGVSAPDNHLQLLPDLLQLLGLHTSGHELLTALAKSIALTLVLFLGPLWHTAMQHWQRQQKAAGAGWQPGIDSTLQLLHQIRDYVVSPVAEEWCFRACMVPLLWMQGFSPQALMFVTPLFFGLCHLHHGWGMVQCYGWSVRIAAICLLQFVYTTVFGWYASWILISTGSTVAAVLVHSFCNVMGLPQFTQMTRSQGMLCAVGAVLFGVIAPRVLQPIESGAFWWSQCC